MNLDPNLATNTSRLSINPPVSSGAGGAISSDFQTFLRMLTVQMQNQNPLEPIEASDYAVQLATFSGVEQQVMTHELLAQLGSRMGMAEMATWVGREVLSTAPVYLDGTERRLIPPEMPGADTAELIVRDEDGREIQRRPVDPQATEIKFGLPIHVEDQLPNGHYLIEVEGFRGGQSLGAHPVLAYSRVEEARSDAGEMLLVLQGGYLINSTQVKGLRAGTD